MSGYVNGGRDGTERISRVTKRTYDSDTDRNTSFRGRTGWTDRHDMCFNRWPLRVHTICRPTRRRDERIQIGPGRASAEVRRTVVKTINDDLRRYTAAFPLTFFPSRHVIEFYRFSFSGKYDIIWYTSCYRTKTVILNPKYEAIRLL